MKNLLALILLSISLSNICLAQKKLTVKATAYTSSPRENGGSTKTATGHKLTSVVGKCVAVDPRIIPLRSQVYVHGYGMFTALDTGGAIKGHRIDLLLPSRTIANRFGRRTLNITVYPPKTATKKKK